MQQSKNSTAINCKCSIEQKDGAKSDPLSIVNNQGGELVPVSPNTSYGSNDTSNCSSTISNSSIDMPPVHFCVCGHCQYMPKEEANICCGGSVCLADDFERLLLHVIPPVSSDTEEQSLAAEQKARRHKAYYKCSHWLHGHQGKGVRQPLPSCLVWKIRGLYSDPTNSYVGFKRNSSTSSE